jgi:hypothetical protein
MIVMTVYLMLSMPAVCPLVRHYRNNGLSDAAIEQLAREHHVPERVISWAKKNC